MRFLRGRGHGSPEHRYATNEGVRIHYEVRGRGPALVLHHAFGGSTSSWHEAGYVTRLERSFRLLLIDGRGHGQSDKPHDQAAYAADIRGRDIAAVFDHAGIDRALYWGYSMGAWLGMAFLRQSPTRITGFVSGAAAAAPSDTYPERTRQRAEAFRSADADRIAVDAEMPIAVARRLVQHNDMAALAALQVATIGWKGHDMTGVAVPSLHYAGEHDALLSDTRTVSHQMRGAQFAVIEDSDHLTTFLRSHEVLEIVRPFLDTHSRSG